jgi:hypothetical protein
MKLIPCRIVASLVAMAFATIVGAQSTSLQGSTNRLPITIRLPRGGGEFVKPLKLTAAAPALSPSNHGGINISTQNFPPGSVQLGNTLPFWTFNVKGSRDNDNHLGVMVGTDPFRNPGTSRIPTYIVPLVFTTHSVAAAYNPTTGYYTTAPGETTIDPTKTDQTCLSKPNNVPVRLIQQSPIVNPAPFVFGGTNVGDTQYVDAFQRANFWSVLGERGNEYHVLLSPVITLPPVYIDVPATAGLALTDPTLFEAAYGFTYCAPMLLIDLNWFDSYLNGTVTPKLQQEGVIAANDFPIFLSYNSAFSIGDVTFIGDCCAIGYHGSTGTPIIDQTYGVVDFDTTGWFSGPPAPIGLGTSTMSHEVAEWMNDPFGSNETAPWGGTGQVAGCQANLEVGDPLSGTDMPTVTMPNGYTYSLQELAFFSWFFGAPSIGVNGWFSNNNTFTTDAGPNCPTS